MMPRFFVPRKELRDEKGTVTGQELEHLKMEKLHLGSLSLVVGPEGGFSRAEVFKANHYGFRSVRVGRRTLRTDTAAFAALSIAQFLWCDIS